MSTNATFCLIMVFYTVGLPVFVRSLLKRYSHCTRTWVLTDYVCNGLSNSDP